MDKDKIPDRLPPGLLIGHAHDLAGLTGCTALIFDKTVVGAAEIAGSAPATSNFSALNPVHVYPRVDGIFLTGGSVFGLNALAGMQRFLEEKGRGFNVGVATIPIVPAAGIFDLAVGNPQCRPTPDLAYKACQSAQSALPAQGSVGAGAGASVGKFFGMKQAMRGGFGYAWARTKSGADVWIFAVVNAFGDVFEPRSRKIIAGARESAESEKFADASAHIVAGWQRKGYGGAAQVTPPVQNTTLLTLVTTAAIDVLEAKKLAQACILGIADAVSPACTIADGDLAIACSVGSISDDLTALSVIARETAAKAIVSAVRCASSLPGLPAAN